MLESALGMAVFGLFGFFFSIGSLRRLTELERRLRRLEQGNSTEPDGKSG